MIIIKPKRKRKKTLQIYIIRELPKLITLIPNKSKICVSVVHQKSLKPTLISSFKKRVKSLFFFYLAICSLFSKRKIIDFSSLNVLDFIMQIIGRVLERKSYFYFDGVYIYVIIYMYMILILISISPKSSSFPISMSPLGMSLNHLYLL